MTHRYFGNWGVAHLLKAKNSPFSKVPVPASRDLPVLRTPVSRSSVFLQAHDTAFKATFILKKLSKSSIKYTNTYDLCLKNISSPKFFV